MAGGQAAGWCLAVDQEDSGTDAQAHFQQQVACNFGTPTTNVRCLPLQVLDALTEVAFEPEFQPSRIEKERKAVVAEAQVGSSRVQRYGELAAESMPESCLARHTLWSVNCTAAAEVNTAG